MRRLGSAALAALLLSAAVLFPSCSREPARSTDADLVVARVNGAPITLRDLKEEIASLQGLSNTAAARGTAPEVSEALRRLLDRALVLQEGRRRGVAVSESELEQEVRRYRSDFPPGGLEKILLQQGIGMREWRERMRRSLLYRKSVDAIAGRKVQVSDEEVRQAYRARPAETAAPERIRVRQLIFDSGEQARAARRRILGDFPLGETVLGKVEQEPSPQSIDLGDLSRDDLPAEIAEELFRLPPGGVSEVVVRDKSYSLFRVVGKRPPAQSSLSEASPRIRESLLRNKREEALRVWIEAERKKADIRVQELLLEQIGGKGR
ncbi:MAG: hypothetical protein Kow00128_14930 [Deltaproteobacteria bacterium]